MKLLERGPFLDALDEYLALASTGAGQMVLLGGEAGIGKSALTRRFCEMHSDDAAVAVGACDGLFTPRPLGPLFDLGRELGGGLYARIREGAPLEELLDALLERLRSSSRPNILVLEDVHWADDATLDLLLLLARRLVDTRTIVVVTFRDDELAFEHPLRVVIGDLVSQANVWRMALPPLSEAAVGELIGEASMNPAEIQALTGGNPFFVTEVIASGDAGIPATVVDAVLARTARLSRGARSLLSAAALIGLKVEQDLLHVIAEPEPDAIEECLSSGVLQAEGNLLVFRHELARRAIERTLTFHSARSLHHSILKALETRTHVDRDLARLAHHAEHAGDKAAVLRYAPEAAANAAAMGSHREAAEQYARALRFGDQLQADQRARLLERRSYECFLTNQLPQAVDATKDALDCWHIAGNPLAEGDNLRWLSRLKWYLGQNAQANRAGKLAIDTLEELPPSRELAMAYSNQSQLEMLGQNTKEARSWGEKAIDLAQRFGEPEIVVHSLNNIGSAEMRDGRPSGRSQLEQSLAMALEAGYEEHVARAYTNLASVSIHQRDYLLGSQYLSEGIRYCSRRELESQRWYMLSERTRLLMDRGQWQEAEDLGLSLLRNAAVQTPITRITALTVMGVIRARRGEPAEEFLDEALELSAPTGELQRLGLVHAARAETAWLQGDLANLRFEARAGYELATSRSDRWALGQLAFWMWRAGEIREVTKAVPEPFRLHIKGFLRPAAESWAGLGCPYEAAAAMAESGEKAAMVSGFTELSRLGAKATSTVLRRDLRSRGVTGIPRGPKRTTRSNVMGLTARENEVLALLREGLTNREIATRLSLSRKTVGHHVSAILNKLGVTSRRAAAAKSREPSLSP